jgi:hypothetical protein
MLQYDPFINVKVSRTEFFHKNQSIGTVGVRRNKKWRTPEGKGECHPWEIRKKTYPPTHIPIPHKAMFPP